jgi:hypothetical protein
MTRQQAAPRHTNRLISETSPYLLQHAHNPVDWYPWGEEALRRARLAAVVALVLTQAVVRGLPVRSWLNCLFGSHEIPRRDHGLLEDGTEQPQRQGRR